MATSDTPSGGAKSSGIDDELSSLQMPGKRALATIWRRKLVVIAAVGACAAAAGVKAYLTAPVYSSSAQIYVDQGGRNLISDQRVDQTLSPAQLATQCELLKSNHIISLALADLQTDPLVVAMPDSNLADLSIGDVKRSIHAGVSRNDETIEVGFESASPVESKLVTDAIVKAYVAFNTDRHKSTTLEILNILSTEKKKLEAELLEKTTAMAAFRRSTGMLSADSERDDAAARRALADAVSQARLAAIDAQTTFDAAARAVGEPEKVRAYLDGLQPGSVPFVTGSEAPQLAGELNSLQQRLREAQRAYGPNHPVIRDLRSRVDQLAVQYLSALLQTSRATEARVKSLGATLTSQQNDALETATRSEELRRLESELRNTQSAVDALGGRISTLKIAEDKPAMTVTVLNGAEDGMKVRPNRPAIVFQGMLLGLLLGCGAAMVDRRVRGADEVSALVGLPLLGTVPSMPANRAARQRGKFVHTDPTSDAAEAYRSVRAALRFVMKNDDARTLLVASPTPGDGKTTLAANLAITMAQAGHRTLVVDADLRQPALHRIFEVSDELGLSSVLQNESTLDKAIQSTAVKNLSILTAGPAALSPADLYNGENFADTLHTLAGQFDYVVIDSPPTLAATDARLIGAVADATVLTVRCGKSLRSNAVQARELLAAVGCKLVGVVVNDIPRAQTLYSGYDSSVASPLGAYDDRPAIAAISSTPTTPAANRIVKPKPAIDPELFATQRKRM